MPPTDELKQALLRQKTNYVEKDVIDVISKAFDMEYGLVARILFAMVSVEGTGVFHLEHNALFPFDTIPEDVRTAIRKAVNDGAKRVRVAKAIEESKSVTASPKDFLPRARVSEICHGCPEAMECAAESISTPQKCWEQRLQSVAVYPLRILGDQVEVEAQHPRGKHLLPISKIHPGRDS